MADLKPVLEFWHFANKLRDIKRNSKKADGYPESPAEHSWKVAMPTYLIADQYNMDVDVLKCMKMILIHDLPEVIAGDVLGTD